MADETPARVLPIELSSVVTSLELVTRELTKKLPPDDVARVVNDLCERLRLLAGERRATDRPFSG